MALLFPTMTASVPDTAQSTIHDNNRSYEMTLDKEYFDDIQTSQVFSASEKGVYPAVGKD